MSDKMIPVSFEKLIPGVLKEYKNFGTIMGVEVDKVNTPVFLGPAAGPHTQLCGNILAAYAAGATCFEFKTVQVLEGKALGIKKPCIYVGNEVFNTEWSTELTIEEAKNEYIKAYIMIHLFSREYGLQKVSDLLFIESVGYDIEGIQSEKIDSFINDMKDASKTVEWKKDIEFLKANIDLFENLKEEDIEEIEKEPCVSNTVTLSTMHGCKKEEIEIIARYLLENKDLNTYIKLNPTLAGKNNVRRLLSEKGYTEIEFDDMDFENDIKFDEAVQIIKNCQEAAKKSQREFGVKLTNTLAVKNVNNELEGEKMYLSGPPLYAITIAVAGMLSEYFNGKIKLSYSGGADESNIREIFDTGISSVTVSSYLLKAGGYKNLTKMKKAVMENEHSKIHECKELAKEAFKDKNTYQKEKIVFRVSEKYDQTCAKCNNCVDVCPNRANVRISNAEGRDFVVHLDGLCNECGCCIHSCILGHLPYLEKFTIFTEKDMFEKSGNDGVLIEGETYTFRNEKNDSWNEKEMKQLISTSFQNGKL